MEGGRKGKRRKRKGVRLAHFSDASASYDHSKVITHVLQITMTTVWMLLLVVLISSSQSVDSQSTTDDETCSDRGALSKLQKDMERLLDNQQQLFRRVGKLQ